MTASAASALGSVAFARVLSQAPGRIQTVDQPSGLLICSKGLYTRAQVIY